MRRVYCCLGELYCSMIQLSELKLNSFLQKYLFNTHSALTLMYHYAKRQPYNTKYDLDNMFGSDLALLKGLPHNSATGKHGNMGMETE